MEKKAFSFFKELDECNPTTLVRLFAPDKYKEYFDNLEGISGIKEDPILLSNLAAATNRSEGLFLCDFRTSFGYDTSNDDIEAMSQDNPDFDFSLQWETLKDELFVLQQNDREMYVCQLVRDLQNKYASLGRRLKSSLIKEDRIQSEAIKNCMSLYADFMFRLVDKVYWDFQLSFPEQFILIQNESYKQCFEEDPDHYEEPRELYPDLMNIMMKNRSLTVNNVQQTSSENKRDISCFPFFDEKQLKSIFKSLLDSTLIDESTKEEHFLYWFGLNIEKPKDLQPINWLTSRDNPQVLLSYFVDRFCIHITDKKIDRWKTIRQVFRIENKVPNTDSMKSYYSKFNSKSKSAKRNFRSQELIDRIFDS